MHFDNTRVRIDLDAVSRNFDAVARKARVPVMAVIKADAYGHGAIPIARLLEGRAAFFGVSSILEALARQFLGKWTLSVYSLKRILKTFLAGKRRKS